MGSQLPALLDPLTLLRRYQQQKSWSNAQLATDMTAYGWTWNTHNIDILMKGIIKLSDHQKEFVKNYLLNSYHDEALS